MQRSADGLASLFKPCSLHRAKIGALPNAPWQDCSPACYLIPLPLLLPDETHPVLSWWIQACLNPCQGRHLLQEDIELSSSPILHRRGAGLNVISPKASGHG